MLDIIINLLTFVLILISLFLILVILMQRASSNAGMGSAFGGGVAESAFGTETTNVLVKATKWSAMAFFLIALTLFLLYMNRVGNAEKAVTDELPDIAVTQEESIPVEAETVAEEAQGLVEETAAEAVDAVDAFTGEATPAGETSETPPTP
jgi:preprotein translocase subunit SecG